MKRAIVGLATVACLSLFPGNVYAVDVPANQADAFEQGQAIEVGQVSELVESSVSANSPESATEGGSDASSAEPDSDLEVSENLQAVANEAVSGTDNNGSSENPSVDLNSWTFTDVQGDTYLVNGAGEHKTGWYQDENGAWFWLDPESNGRRATGFVTVGSSIFYLDPSNSGIMATGWVYVGGSWYFADASGYIARGWLLNGGVWYWLDPATGAMACSGTHRTENNLSSFNSSGAWLGYLKGWQLVGSDWYWLGSDSAIKTGWHFVYGAWYWFSPDTGVMATGFVDDAGSRYYLDPALGGALHTGWVLVDGTWYYGDPSCGGALACGWRFIGGAWYWFEGGNAAMQTGWIVDGFTSYHLASWGGMDSNCWYFDGEKGEWSYFASSGAALSGWQDLFGALYYLDPSEINHGAKIGFFMVDGAEYYADGSNAIVKSAWVSQSDGVDRFAGEDGKLGFALKDGKLYSDAQSATPLVGFVGCGGETFYADPATGLLAKGWATLSDSTGAQARYYFDSAGRMGAGWEQVDGSWYYFEPSTGHLMTGWQLIDGSWFYLDPQTGAMATGEISLVEGGVTNWYYLKAGYGSMVTGWQYFPQGDRWCYYGSSGARYSGWQWVDDRWIEFDAATGKASIPSSWMGEKVAAEASRRDMYGLRSGWCQAWVATVYARAGASGASLGTAHEAWLKWGVSKSKAGIPVGATVYTRSWSGSHGYDELGVWWNDFGHVGIYIGNGKVASLRHGAVWIDDLTYWTNWDGWYGWGWNGGVALW